MNFGSNNLLALDPMCSASKAISILLTQNQANAVIGVCRCSRCVETWVADKSVPMKPISLIELVRLFNESAEAPIADRNHAHY